MSTPIAITASNGWLGIVSVVGAGVLEREEREAVGDMVRPPRRSVAVAPAWTCEPAITLYSCSLINKRRTRMIIEERGDAPRTSEGKLKAARDRLDDDVRILHSGLLQLLDRALNERVNDRLVPPCVHNSDAEWRAVETSGVGLETFDCGHRVVVVVLGEVGTGCYKSQSADFATGTGAVAYVNPICLYFDPERDFKFCSPRSSPQRSASPPSHPPLRESWPR